VILKPGRRFSVAEKSATLGSLERLTNQNASIYGNEAVRYNKWNLLLNGLSVVLSAFLLTLALGSDEFFTRTIGLMLIPQNGCSRYCPF
jgi:hypothetical protein